MMANDRIWPAMSRAFESATGDLADRMLAALEAAEAPAATCVAANRRRW